MAGKSVRARRRTLGSLLGAGGIAVLVAVSAAACASTSAPSSSSSSPVGVVSGGSASPSNATSTGPTGGASPSAAPPTATGSTGSQSPAPAGGPVVAPQTQLTSVPAGQKLVAFDSASRGSSSTVLYVGLMSQGGACGQYDVVLQQSASSVGVGLVKVPSGGRMCPMYVTHTLVEVKLSAPLGSRSVVDLATGGTVPVSAA